MTIGALRAVRELDIVLGRDLSLVAFDDFELLSLYEPPITAVAQPVRQLGREAGKLLLARMHGDSVNPRRLRLPTELIVRDSVAKLREQSRTSRRAQVRSTLIRSPRVPEDKPGALARSVAKAKSETSLR